MSRDKKKKKSDPAKGKPAGTQAPPATAGQGNRPQPISPNCPKCGAKTGRAKFCVKCGTKTSFADGDQIKAQGAKADKSPWEIQPKTPQVTVPAEARALTSFKCPICGNAVEFVNKNSSYYCTKCNVYPWRCGKCMESVSDKMEFCINCGEKLR